MSTVDRITALDDPRISHFRDIKDKDLRDGHGGLFMAESEIVIRRLLRDPARVHSLLLDPGKYEAMRDLLATLPDDVPVYVAEQPLLSEIAGFHLHRGALAAGRRPDPSRLTIDAALGHLRDGPTIRLVLAEGLTNVDNMGALFRNAAGLGADGVVIDASSCDPLYRKALRVSVGHVLTVPFAVSERWHDDLEHLQSAWGMTLVAAEAGGGALPLHDLPVTERLGLVFGSEAEGLDERTLARCDAVCEIPMAPGVSSLNVAVASAVFLYEIQRRG